MQIMSVVVGQGRHSMAELALGLGLDYSRTSWQSRDFEVTSDWNHNVPSDQLWWDTYVVQTASMAEARQLLPMLRSEGRARRLVLVIPGYSLPSGEQAWTPRHLQSRAVTSAMVVPGIGMAVVIEGGKWVNVHAAMLAALRCCSGATDSPVLGGLRVGVTEASACAWLAGDPLGSFMSAQLLQPEPDDIYAVDVVLGSADLVDLPGRPTPPIWPLPGDMLPPVDTAVISPIGFLPMPDGTTVSLEPQDINRGQALTEQTVADLRRRSYLAVDGARFSGGDVPLARRLSQLAVAGVPMLAESLSAPVRSLLGAQLAERIEAFRRDDPLDLRESKSIDMRRTAMELYSPKYRWNTLLGHYGRPAVPAPAVSAVLASRRPDKLASALAQLGRQSWDAMEVVLVLHGFGSELPEVRHALAKYPGVVTVRSVPSDTVFGDVLNAGVRAAGGDLITKIDDDDWYGEHHIRDLVHAREFSAATLVGCQVEFVYLETLDITTRRPPAGEQYSDHVAGGTMMIGKEDLRELGGWRPVHRAVDRCLLQSVQSAGGLIYRSHGQNYLMHRYSEADSHGGHTWNPEDSVFLQSVAEQWDGFRPPPQIDVGGEEPAVVRHTSLRSHFSSF
jgi:hypothetical protein